MSLTLPVKINFYWDCYYPEGRFEEIKQTFDLNLNNPLFDQIICYYCKQNKNNLIPEESDKVKVVEIRTAFPYWDDMFHLTNHLTGDYDINIISTNDIIYGSWDRQLLNHYLRPDSFFCIARHELYEKWQDYHNLSNLPSHKTELAGNSADVWVYRGKIRIFGGHIGKGSIWGGEEVLAEQAFRNGYMPSNPGLLFPTYHNHLNASIRSGWPSENNKSKHCYTLKTGRCICMPYNPQVSDAPYPQTLYFDFELPEYTPKLV